MQSRATHPPTDFKAYINNTIGQALDDLESAYLDSIQIYRNLEEEHEPHVECIIECWLESGLHLKPEKCEFHKVVMRCLGLIISTIGISMDENKVKTVRNWSREKKTINGRLKTLVQLQQFFSFCNCY
jgi:hypothetical protein